MAWKIAAIVALLLILLQIGLTVASWRAPALGLDPASSPQAPRLLPCPGTPNCVCSQDQTPGFSIEPLSYSGDPGEAIEQLKSLCRQKLGSRLVKEDGHYLRFECVTPLVRYVDDLEFLLDDSAGVIHVRSASRVGQSDFGVNRKRVEEIRRLFGQ